MPSWRFNLFLAFWSLLLGYALAQEIHTINVGLQGSFFDPQFVSAVVNDTVRFVFSGDLHGVTQCDENTPCVAKIGGFNAGLAGRRGNYTLPAPTWDLKITDDQNPIWFFCPMVQPVSHCNAGMVGAINPPSEGVFDHFVDLAKVFTGTQPPTPAVTLTGFGAIAQGPPAISSTTLPPSVSSTLIIPSTSFSSSIPIPTSTPTIDSPTSDQSSRSKNVGAIVGGTIGGLAFLGVAAALMVLLLRHRKRSRRASRDFFNYEARNPAIPEEREPPPSSAALPVPRWKLNFEPATPSSPANSTTARLLDPQKGGAPSSSIEQTTTVGSATAVSSQEERS